MACLAGEDAFLGVGTEGLICGRGGSAGFFLGSGFGGIFLGSGTGSLFDSGLVLCSL